jgi:hypothetical protein
MIRYVTRWALGNGILIVDGSYTGCGKYFRDKGHGVFVNANEAYETLEEANACARNMAQLKAVSLRAKADKLSDPLWEPKVRR